MDKKEKFLIGRKGIFLNLKSSLDAVNVEENHDEVEMRERESQERNWSREKEMKSIREVLIDRRALFTKWNFISRDDKVVLSRI